MARSLKVCVIGAGSSYTPELIEGFIESRSEVQVDAISLMDIDERKLRIVGGLAQRMVRAAGSEIAVTITSDRAQAMENSDFVITQIRVGGMAARILDEKIPPQFGAIGQETTGPGGFAKALRTIPVILSIAEDIGRLAPQATLLNFTNPAGLITEALYRYSSVPAIGLCNLPIGAEMRLSQRMGISKDRLSLDWVGLNHLNWIRGASIDGADVWDELFSAELNEARQRPEDDWGFSADLLETLGMIPCGYLNYFYNRDRILAKQKTAAQTRGEEVQQIENQLMAMYEDPGLTEKPQLLEKRGGAYYSKVAVALISALANNAGSVSIVNTLNRGAVPDLPADVVVEVPSSIGGRGAIPLVTKPLPAAVKGLVEAVKSYERLTAIAGAEGDRHAALQALLAHPLVPSFDAAFRLLDALLEAHRPHLPQFFHG